MYAIIKYQLKGRKKWMFLIIGALLLLNAVAWVMELTAGLRENNTPNPIAVFWMALSMGAVMIVLGFQFFRCSTGYVSELLYKDTNYLMLTIPRRGRQILGGRFIAGFIEFMVYLVSGMILFSVHGFIYQKIAGGSLPRMVFLLREFIYQLFTANFLSLIRVLFIWLCLYIIIGITLTFAFVASRSFVRNKLAASVISFFALIFISNWTVKLGDFISARFGWYMNIPFSFENIFMSGHGAVPGQPATVVPLAAVFTVPAGSLVLFIVLSLILFPVASWLMEHKVEV